ncbi:MAG TPA: Gfo/Idh/MocA family oxidoreductase [Victivallales bacterium]|nr:Gfo/Idh/MocA family oxidoreductase [Victivallales bacterium]
MKMHKVGIIMNGVTGRMGTNQHLMRSIVAIIKQGGVKISDTESIMPDPILIGRNETKLQELLKMSGLTKSSTDLESALKDPAYSIYFDSQTTDRRVEAVKMAIKAGKHAYCEKPIAVNSKDALELHRLAKKAGVKSGVVQDKLWLPGLIKLKNLMDSGFFGKILSVRGEFGYWVFEGDIIPAQRPSWNYRKEDGGSMILDMFPHWRYVIDNIFGDIKSLSCIGATHINKRVDEKGKEYNCTADDSAYAMFELKNGIMANFNSSWCVRVRRDDLFTMQVDGTKGSAVAGLRKCLFQSAVGTPKAVWNPDIDNPINFYDGWTQVPDTSNYDNAFKIQWELFLKHVVCGSPFRWSLLEGAKGVQLAEIAFKSWKKKAWIEVPNLG